MGDDIGAAEAFGAAEWTAMVLDGNGGVRDDGHWHAEHCPGAPAFPCHCALIENEMSDYRMILRHCSIIYDEASGGRISKPNTLPSEVVACMQERQREEADELIKEATEELEAEVQRLRAFAQRVVDYCELPDTEYEMKYGPVAERPHDELDDVIFPMARTALQPEQKG